MLKRTFSAFIMLIMIITAMTGCFDPSKMNSAKSESSTSISPVTAASEETLPNELLINGEIPCRYEAIHYGNLTGIKEKALNYTGEDQAYYTAWMFKAENTGELREIFDHMRNPSGLYVTSYETEDKAYNSLYGAYTDSFFSENLLLVVYREAGSGGDVYDISEINITDQTLTLSLINTKVGFTNDMSGWLFIVSIHKEAVQNVTRYITQ